LHRIGKLGRHAVEDSDELKNAWKLEHSVGKTRSAFSSARTPVNSTGESKSSHTAKAFYGERVRCSPPQCWELSFFAWEKCSCHSAQMSYQSPVTKCLKTPSCPWRDPTLQKRCPLHLFPTRTLGELCRVSRIFVCILQRAHWARGNKDSNAIQCAANQSEIQPGVASAMRQLVSLVYADTISNLKVFLDVLLRKKDDSGLTYCPTCDQLL